MSHMTPPVKKMARLSIMEKTKREQWRHLRTPDRIPWGDMYALIDTWHSCPPRPSLSVILMAVFALLDANAYALRSPSNILLWQFFIRETSQGHSIILHSGDCPVEGWQRAVSFILYPNSAKCSNAPLICFPYRQYKFKLECLAEVETYEEKACTVEKSRSTNTMFSSRKPCLYTIPDPWKERWHVGAQGKLYASPLAQTPVADLRASRQFVSAPWPVLPHHTILSWQTGSRTDQSHSHMEQIHLICCGLSPFHHPP